MIRLLVTGGRDYTNAAKVDRVLRRYVEKAGGKTKLLVIHGRARGLDTLVDDWCDKNAVPCVGMRAPWAGLPGCAGPVRNQWMINYCNPTHCYVFPGGRGTQDMKDRAIHAKLKVQPKGTT